MPDPSTTVILGGTSGIGASIARRVARPDGRLVLGYLQNRERAEALAQTLPGRVVLVEGNIADRSVVERIVDAVGTPCQALIHSVAVTAFKPITRTRRNQWDLTLAVSARSFLELAVGLLGPLAESRGSVVAISSQGSVRHVPSYGALGPAKAALESIVRDLAVEFAADGVRVNGVRAGLVEGPITKALGDRASREVVQRTPLGRLGTPDEIAAVAGFLISPDASWITGQILDVDGGMGLL